MQVLDCIGLDADFAYRQVKNSNPNMKIIIHPTSAPRHKGEISLSKCMVVRQKLIEGVLELTVVVVD